MAVRSFLTLLLLFHRDADGVDAAYFGQDAVRSDAVSARVVAAQSDARELHARCCRPTSDVGRDFLHYFLNSVWVSSATTVLGVVVAVPAAYAFSRFRFPGRKPLFYAVLLRNMFPAVVFLMPLFILMRCAAVW